MEKIKVIVFDLEGVVVSTWHGFYKLIPDMASLGKDAMAEITDGKMIKELNLGRISEDEFVEWAREFSSTSASADAIKSAIRASIIEMPGTRALLSKLKGEYRLVLLTNYASEWFDYVDKRFGLRALFDDIFVSSVTGFRKPDPAAYRVVTETIGVGPGECLFIDDNERKIEGARQFGMAVLRFSSAPLLAHDLSDRLGITFK